MGEGWKKKKKKKQEDEDEEKEDGEDEEDEKEGKKRWGKKCNGITPPETINDK